MILSGRQCIYCLEAKVLEVRCAETGFNGEHVIQRAFTRKIQGNLVLQDRVCWKCNSFFDKELDVKFTRNTLTAVRRYDVGMKPLSELSDYRPTPDVTTYSVNEKSIYDGAPMKPCNRNGQLSYEYVPHLAHEYQGQVNRVFISDLDDKTRKLPNLTLGVVTLIESNDEDKRALEAAVARRGGSMMPIGAVSAGDIQVFSGEQMSESDQRAVAKIAFNYFAYTTKDHSPNVVLGDEFSDIRRFVKIGTIPPAGYLRLVQVDLRSEVGNDHLLRLRTESDLFESRVYCDVTLFGLYKLAIRLATLKESPSYGLQSHRWSISEKRCYSVH